MLFAMIGIWLVVTVILVALSIHRSIFVTREEDTIFVSEAESSTKEEYATVIERLKRLEIVLKIFSFVSGGLMVVIAAMWLYEKLYG